MLLSNETYTLVALIVLCLGLSFYYLVSLEALIKLYLTTLQKTIVAYLLSVFFNHMMGLNRPLSHFE